MKLPLFACRAVPVLGALFLSSLFLSGLRANAEPYAWRAVALGGGGFVSGIVYHPEEPGLVYVRTDVGGAYRWELEGRRWIPLNDDLGRADSQLTGVVSLAVDPRAPHRLYLACGQYLPGWGRNGAILRSADRGRTWTRTELPIRLGGNSDGRSTGERLQVDPGDGRILWLGTHQDGLWKSTDQGVTWARVPSFSPVQVTWVLPDRSSGGEGTPVKTLYVGTGSISGQNVCRSTDGGASWTAIAGQPNNLIPHHADIDYRDGGKLYLAYSNQLGPNGATAGGVWKFDPANGSWTALPVPAGQGGFAGVSVDAQKAGVVVVSTLNRWSPGDEVYRSTNAGATWRPLLAGATFNRDSAPWSIARSPHWIGDVKINPHDSNEAIFITGYGLWAAEDLHVADTGGKPTWEFRNRELEETVPLELVSPPSGAPLLAAYGDIGVFRHADLTQSPPLADYYATHRSTTVSLAMAAASPEVIVRTHYNGTRGTITRDGGATSIDFAASPPTSGNGPGQIAVSADGQRLVWMPERSVAYRSTDSGATWTVATGSPGGASASLKPAADTVAAATFYIFDPGAGRLFVSRDGGASFAATGASLANRGGPAEPVPGHAGHVWVPAEEGGLYRSSDYGATFVPTDGIDAAWRVGFGRGLNEQTPSAYLWGRVGNQEGIFRSDDEGASWVRINDDRRRYGWINDVVGDAQVHGRVYLATGGRGVVVGEPAAWRVLPRTAQAVFRSGQSGAYALPTELQTLGPWVAEHLPDWATFDSATGGISGQPTTAPGTLAQVQLRAQGAPADAAMTLNLFVAGTGEDLGMYNLSARSRVGTGADQLIAGAVLGGGSTRTMLVRAVGPTLDRFDVTNTLARPVLTLLRSPAEVLATNTGWANSPDQASLRAAMQRTGAFAWDDDSADSALLLPLSPGGYSAQVAGANDTTGTALVEVYDAGEGGARPLANLSVRAVVGTGDQILIGGLTLGGGGSRRALVRAIGPTLEGFGVPGALRDPQLTAYSGTSVLATNQDWSTDPATVGSLRTDMERAGAFALPSGSRDAALVLELVRGNYTFHVGGADGGTGVVLLEIYLLPL